MDTSTGLGYASYRSYKEDASGYLISIPWLLLAGEPAGVANSY